VGPAPDSASCPESLSENSSSLDILWTLMGLASFPMEEPVSSLRSPVNTDELLWLADLCGEDLLMETVLLLLFVEASSQSHAPLSITGTAEEGGEVGDTVMSPSSMSPSSAKPMRSTAVLDAIV